MLHPSYADLMDAVNQDAEENNAPLINSRYSIVMATARRARQLIDKAEPLVYVQGNKKPLSIAIDELDAGELHILGNEEG